jgi:CheY-like chemotaxis protein
MRRILVIDDDLLVLDIIAEMLTNAGYAVVQATNGKAGVRLYRERPFDLIVTDLMMPEKDGLEVIMELRKDFPAVKVIIMSGGNIQADHFLEPARLLGAARPLQKPFKEDQLLEAVRQVLEEG